MADVKRARAAAAAERSLAAKWGRVRFRDNRDPATRSRALGGWGCWCGRADGHDWPGRDAGAPHPRGVTGG